MNKKTDKEPKYRALTLLFILLMLPLFFVCGYLGFKLPYAILAHAETFSEDGYLYCHRTNSQSYISMFFDDANGNQNTLYWDDPYIEPSSFTISESSDSLWIYTPSSTSIEFDLATYHNASSYSDCVFSTDIIRNITAIEIVNSGTVYFYSYEGGTSHNHSSTPSYTLTVVDNNVHGITSSIFEFAGFAEPELSVEFLPFDLQGYVNEVMTVNGQEMRSYAVQMIINNPSSKNYQYFWCICPKGEHPYFSGVNDLNNYNGRAFSGSVQWCHVKESWAYILNPDIINATLDSTTEDTSNLNIPVSQYTFLPSSWQYISANSSKTESAFFKNMKLFQDQEYTCYVYAVETSCDKLSFISEEFTSGYLDEYLGNKIVDFRDAECIYSSNFKMGFTTEFDPDYNAVGVISYDPDSNSNSLFNKSSARYNPETNALEMGYNIANYRNNPTSYSFSGSANRTNLGSFSSAFSNVFSFVSAFFSYLPSSYQQMYLFGLTSLVVLAILKAVK